MKDHKLSYLFYIACAGGVGVAALAVTLCWLINDFAVIKLSSVFMPMPFSTALCFFLTSMALLVPRRLRTFIAGVGVFDIVVAFIALVEYVLGVNTHVDDIFLNAFSQVNSAEVARMAPNTATGILLAGSAMVIRAWAPARLSQRQIHSVAILGSIVAALGAAPLVGYFANISTTAGWGKATFMALHTALCFVLLGISLMIFVYRRGKNLLWLPMSLGVGLFVVTLSLSAAIRNQESEHIDALMRDKALDISSRLNSQLTEFYAAVDRMAQRWNIASGIPLPYWENDAKAYLDGYRFLAGMSITDRGTHIIDVVPDENKKYIGFKMDEDMERGEATLRAIRTLQPQCTDVITFKTGYKGFLYILPLFKDGQYDGLQVAGVRSDLLINTLFDGDEDWQLYGISITVNNTPVFDNLKDNDIVATAGRQSAAIVSNGKIWRVSIDPTRQLLASQKTSLALAVMIVGFFTTFLISLCGYMALKWRDQTDKLQGSERFNNALLAGAGSFIIAADKDCVVTSFNQAAENALGYSADEVLHKHTPALWHDAQEIAAYAIELNIKYNLQLEPGLEVFTTLAQRESAKTYEWTFIRKDRSRFPVNLSITCLRDHAGKIVGYMGVGVDVTQLKKQQEALKLSEETFRSAMEHASIGKALVAPDGTFIKVNSALCNLLGYTAEEMLKIDYKMITYPDDLALDQSKVTAVLAGKIPRYQIEKRYIHKSGRIVWAILSVSLVRNADGSPRYFISQVHDITERKEVESLKDEFVSMVSHELRTPLTSIRGSLGLMVGVLSKGLPPQISHLIDIAYKNTERLIVLINDILDIDKIAAGKMNFTIKAEDTAALVRQAIEANGAYADRYRVSTEVAEIPTGIMVNVDSNRFNQALLNLLSNAVKFTATGSTVKVWVDYRDGQVRINVRDQGPGIADEFRERIFAKFSQMDSSATREKGGTGLGLYITRQIVEHMGGKVGFDSVEGQGATFWLSFPAAHYQNTAVNSDSSAFSVPRRVLICEDDETAAAILQLQLQRGGFISDIAPTIDAARQMLGEGHYMAMTLDLAFPEGSGLDFIRELSANGMTKRLPIVVVSARADEGRKLLNGDAIGIIDWIPKPLDEQRLTDVLKRIVVHAGTVPTDVLPRVLHVEDDECLSRLLATALDGRAHLINAATLGDARDRLKNESFALIILDVGLPDGNGLALLSNMNDCTNRPVPVLILSAVEVPPAIQDRVAATMVKATMSETRVVETILSLIKKGKICPVL